MKKSLNKIILGTSMMAGLGIDPGFFCFNRTFDDEKDFNGDPKPKSKRHQDQENIPKFSKKQKAKRR